MPAGLEALEGRQLLTAWTEHFIPLMPSGPEKGGEFGGRDVFGSRVAIYGNTAIVGAPGSDRLSNDPPTEDHGDAFIFERVNGVWTERQRLGGRLTTIAPGDRFGSAVAIHGDTIAIGSIADSDGAQDRGGSVDILVKREGTWSPRAMVTSLDLTRGDQFGFSIDLDDDTLVVGAPWESESAHRAGAVYVFARVGREWRQQAKLLGSQTANDHRFGTSVAVENNVVVVGTLSGGSAYVFELQTEGGWREVSRFEAPPDVLRFGESVDISDGRIVVGASLSGNGHAYAYRQSPGGWRFHQELIPTEIDRGSEFGHSVSISGDIAVVGAAKHGAQDKGAAVVFELEDGVWSQETVLAPNHLEADDLFGVATSIQGSTILVGASGRGNLAGAAFAFTGSGDVDDDGSLTSSDIDVLFGQAAAETPDPAADLDGNGSVDELDVNFIVKGLLGTRRGDADLNGVIDFDDFRALSANFGDAGGWGEGDFNGDGVVDFSDFIFLSQNYLFEN